MKILFITILLLLQNGAATGPKPIPIPADDYNKCVSAFNDMQNESFVAEHMQKLLVDRSSDCFAQVAKILGDRVDMKKAVYNSELYRIRAENNVPRDWIMNAQKKQFEPPQPKP